jgi:hypothetical protein
MHYQQYIYTRLHSVYVLSIEDILKKRPKPFFSVVSVGPPPTILTSLCIFVIFLKNDLKEESTKPVLGFFAENFFTNKLGGDSLTLVSKL